MKINKQDFLNQKHKCITIIGMSGVGKTTIANKLSPDKWFHYSGDYRIGTRYLSEAIIDNIKAQAMQIPFLRNLLLSDSIYLANNISIHNLEPLTAFLGKFGDENCGGMTLNDFKSRQDLHRKAEIKAMLDVPEFIKKAKNIYQYPNFINDVGGSICEVANKEVLQTLADNTIIFYLKADQETERKIIKRAVANPKPMYYHPEFLEEQIKEYKKVHKKIFPDDFASWIFPRLIQHRKPLYQKIANDYGYTLDASEIKNIKNEKNMINWLADSL